MGESDRAPQVQFEIDQEIFIDSVAEGDVVEDATVATEVTLFDRVGDAYVLEGAIVFAGYTKRDDLQDEEQDGDAGDALSFNLGGGNVRHFHHRLPFVLRVPVKAQPRGIVNVNSRISSWKLEVISEGWIRILGDLTVLGLNSNHGYHFQCGAQEEGDLLFQPTSSTIGGYEQETHEIEDFEDDTAYTDVSQPDNATELNPQDLTETEEETYELVRGSQDGDFHQAFNGEQQSANYQDVEYAVDNQDVDAISHARGGHGEASTEAGAKPQNSEDFSSTELQRLDRLFGVKSSDEHSRREAPAHNEHFDERSEEASQPAVEPDAQGRAASEPEEPAEVNRTGETAGASDEIDKSVEDAKAHSRQADNVVEFDFEHQVSDVGAVDEEDGSAEFSEGADALQRAQNSPQIVVGEQTAKDDNEERGEGTPTSAKEMWSFVDFNQPDTKYTLRYVIVMEEESVEAVSERLNCSRDELTRLNHLTPDAIVRAGQPLAVPERREA